MQTKRISSQFLLPACLLLGSIMLAACGQKGPLTLPQAAPEVAEPAAEKPAQPADNEQLPGASEEQNRGPL
ncbi:LPS translocon maturation chaperone LptM [Arsukibacterium sp.]|uniref:LPS translocon maturation chaperone LptM n=1 Tax=Arsukibacterium sp. TaxID=1977258 RepID=UPI00299EB045|nr:lipoprotein [Arsukibacterium sp.]MDX1539422.1 lipoprotein [Arsukibacterium sp.]